MQDGGDGVGFAVAGVERRKFIGDDKTEEESAHGMVEEWRWEIGLCEGESCADEGCVRNADTSVYAAGEKGHLKGLCCEFQLRYVELGIVGNAPRVQSVHSATGHSRTSSSYAVD